MTRAQFPSEPTENHLPLSTNSIKTVFVHRPFPLTNDNFNNLRLNLRALLELLSIIVQRKNGYRSSKEFVAGSYPVETAACDRQNSVSSPLIGRFQFLSLSTSFSNDDNVHDNARYAHRFQPAPSPIARETSITCGISRFGSRFRPSRVKDSRNSQISRGISPREYFSFGE